MIVTKAWLNEWVDLDGVSTDEVCKALNATGLEVDSLDEIRVPKGVKIALVKSCQKHPDADKLNVCQVDLGDETTQIVCGAKNVAAGQFVAVATIGTVLGKDFKIKKAKLRGVESNGMICSSTEIGLPKMNDGIMVLDDSIGEMKLGKELSEYPLINDDIIDIELTANRGDCLSINGVSRDLGSSLKRDKRFPKMEYKEDRRGISRVLELEVERDIDASVEYRFFEINKLRIPFLYDFRLACIGQNGSNSLEDYLSYATHATGVILRAYPSEDKTVLRLKKNSLGFDAVYSDGKELSIIGIGQDKNAKVGDEKFAIIEASYIDPDLISQKKSESKIETDDSFYRSSRGSEPKLDLGLEYLCSLSGEDELSVYAGTHKYQKEVESNIVKVELGFINSFIGQDITSSDVVRILEDLGFGVNLVDDSFMVSVPQYRHDIKNKQDIIEELVRIIGIDNISSKPLEFVESTKIDNSAYKNYKKRTYYRNRAAGVGFFEAIHYFFDNRELMQKYDLELLKESLDLKNPITNELNTIRSTLLLHLINSASRNVKFGKKSVRLFEIGRVVDSNRDEKSRLSFIFSGLIESESIRNHGKPNQIEFFKFSQLISRVIGDIELKSVDDKNLLVSPYEYARVFIDGEDIGFIGRLHIEIEREFDLPRSYICELDFDRLKDDLILAKPYSKFPALNRDLSLLIPKDMKFGKIRDYLNGVLPKEVIGFAPIDLYESEELGEYRSVTVKFEIQSFDETLEEERITAIVSDILTLLKEKFGIGIR